MAMYTIRYYFEYMADTCLWGGDGETREQFGMNIDPQELPLTEGTVQAILAMATRWQQSLNWENPAEPSPWSQAEFDEFFADATDLYARIRAELNDQFELVNVLSNYSNSG